MAESIGSLRVSLGLDSLDFSRGLKDVNRKLKALDTEFKAAMAGAGKFDNSLDSLRSKADVLSRTIQTHKAKVSELKRQYEESVRTTGRYSAQSEKLLAQYNRSVAAMRKTEDQLGLVNRKIREQSTGFGQLSSKINASINTISTKMKALDAAFKASTAGVKNFGSTSDQLRQKADHLNQSISLQEQRLKELRRLYLESKRAKGADAQETLELSARMNEATAQLRETQAQLRNTNAQIDRQANAWNRLGDKLKQNGESLRSIGGNLQSVGSDIATTFGAATLAVGGGLALSTKKAMDFEQQMSNVKAVMNPAEANKYSEALTNLSIKLGADTKYSALEAAQGMEELVKAGVSTQDILNGGLQGALSLATAGGLELADAAEIASTALNAFKDDNLSVAKAADILAGAANSSATTVGEMKYGLQMTSAVAAGMGVTFKDTSTTLALFAQNGLKGSDAGTSMKTMLSRLVPMTKSSYETMHDLGLVTLDTSEAFKRMTEKGFKPASKNIGDIYDALNRYIEKTTGAKQGTEKFEKAFDKATKSLGIMDNKFFDTNGNIRSMSEVSGELSKALDGLSAKERQEALYNIFGSDAIRGALILGKEGSKGFEKMAAAMDKIKADNVAAEKMNNLKGQIEELSGAFETAQINIGNALVPVISALVSGLQKVVDAFNSLSPGMQRFVAISLAVTTAIIGIIAVIGALLAAAGGALIGIGSLQIAWGMLTVKIAAAGGMMGIFSSVLAALTSPITLTVAAIAGLVAILVYAYKHSDSLRKMLDKAFDSIKQAAAVAYEGAKKALDGIVSAAEVTASYVIDRGQKMWAGFAEGAAYIGSAIQRGFNNAVNAAGSFIYGLGQRFTNLFGQGVTDRVSGIAGTFFDQLRASFSSVGGIVSIIAPSITALGLTLGGVSKPIGIVITALVSLAGFLYRLYQTNEDFRNSVQSVWSQIALVIGNIVSAVQPIINQFIGYFSGIAAELAPEFAKTGEVIMSSISSLGPTFTELGNAFNELWTTLGQSFSEIAVQVAPVIQELGVTFAAFLPQVVSLVGQLIQTWASFQVQFAQLIMQVASVLLPMLAQAFTSLLPPILQVVSSVIPIVLQLIQSLVPVVTTIATTLLPTLLQAVQAIFPPVLAIIQSVVPIVATLLTSVAQILSQLAVTLLPLILQVVQAVFPVVMSVIQVAMQVAVTVLQLVATIIRTVLIPAIQFVLKIVQVVFPVVVSVIQNALNIVINVVKFFTALLKGNWSGVWNAILGILKSIWNIITAVIRGAVNVVLTLFSGLVNGAISAWNFLKDRTVGFFKSIGKFAADTFHNMIDGAKALPGKIGDGIKNMAGKALSGVKSLGNTMIGGLEGIINGLTQKGINKLLDTFGVDKKLRIPKLEIPRFAKGTPAGGHKGGLAILGDGGGPELFRTPSGFTGLSPGTDTLFNLPKGTQVLPHKETKSLLEQGVPAFKKGTKNKSFFDSALDVGKAAVDAGKTAVNKVKDFAFDAWDYVSNPSKLIAKTIESLGLKLPDISGAFGTIAKGAFGKVKDSAVGFMKKKLADFAGMFGSGEKASGNVKQWVRAAMAKTNSPESWFTPLVTIAMKESGGRTGPSTVNRWDSNWRRGTPSMGLMQTIKPTFDAYKLPGMNDIMNPVHNAVAAIRYIKSRYGNPFNTPGIRSMSRGGPYKGYKIGDIVTQKQLAWVAEEGPEAIIPLQNNRQRAQQLWTAAGEKIGMDPSGGSNAEELSLLRGQNALLRQTNSLLTAILQKDPSVVVDTAALTDSVEKGQAQNIGFNKLLWGDR
ncbi:phage tail tape measure protein [Bacillus paralicheniformis]|uniref:phage tail tape measure protein n=1 Tax=Bacillus paralicheniformis TaxID=1648923 RepID=UPI0013EF4581|nr:phage tail tape measure protein [Bacillus paralicheniformis]QII49469.1 phage tail tape measure protein [Bacillus paralicheniformis]